MQDGTLAAIGGSVDNAASAYQAVVSTLVTCNKSYAAGTRRYLNDHGLRWGCGSEGYTIFNTIVTPNSVTYPWSVCKWGTSGAAQQSEYIKADSYHPGGVNVLFADGSVRFVKDGVNVNTWMALGTRANSEVISADAY